MSALRTGLCRPGIIMYLAVVLLLVISSTYSGTALCVEYGRVARCELQLASDADGLFARESRSARQASSRRRRRVFTSQTNTIISISASDTSILYS
ncbi:unnamed protein product [Trichogramma brassicae]|uniref:Uncharacterized protein n=1 Tax=Trichogramma brassicae TaxID=86971 RepID=A0A6H5I1D8_9HYME|nr:unnamed protein product [Trichogramma brassicae]